MNSNYRLREDVSRFIKNNVNLTDTQKAEINQFFKDHSNLNGKINWQSEGVTLPYSAFKKVMDDFNSRFLPKGTLEDLTEGRDYEIVYNKNGIIGYEILTYKASIIIASNNVGPEIWSDLSKSYKEAPGYEGNIIKDFPTNDKGLYGGAKWCTAYNHSDEFWNQYTKDVGLKFVYLVGNVPTGKVAIGYFPKDKWTKFYHILDNTQYRSFYDTYFKTMPLEFDLLQNVRSIWNGYNEEITTSEHEIPEITEIADELIGQDSIEDSVDFLMYSLFKPNMDGSFSKYKDISGDRSPNFIKEHHMNRRYMVRYGKIRRRLDFWDGDFDCSDWGLESLENLPNVINGDLICKNNLEDFTESDIPRNTTVRGRKIFE